MIYALCVVAGFFSAFYNIGNIVVFHETKKARATQLILIVVTDLLLLILATFFMPAISTYFFTFAFTRGLIYGISDLDRILTIKPLGHND